MANIFKKVLIIGSGGREHALVKACLKSPLVETVIAAPGNGGMKKEVECFDAKIEEPHAKVKNPTLKPRRFHAKVTFHAKLFLAKILAGRSANPRQDSNFNAKISSTKF